MKKSHLLVVPFVAVRLLSANAAETDTFTNRNEPLRDSSEIINQMANEDIKIVLGEVNNKDGQCDEKKLYKELRKYFSNHFSGKFVNDVINSSDVIKRPVTIENSVYREWHPWDGLGMGISAIRASGLTIASVVKIGNTQIGTDKFEHFFGQGFRNFKSYYLKNKSIAKIMHKEVEIEEIFLGGNKIGNGVFSYGDLSANFNGMRFWNHILQLRNDIIGTEDNIGPYVVCENNKWIQIKGVDFRDYVDDSMDEAINCSKFPSKKTAQKFSREVHKLGLSCPVDIKKVEELETKYGPVARWIINTKGTGVINYLENSYNK